MPSLIYAEETPQTFKEFANYLRNAAERLEATAKVLEKEGIETIDVPLKRMAFDALGNIEKWTNAAQASFLEAKKKSGAFGPDTSGQGPRAGKKSKGSGNFRGKKKKE